MGEKVLEVGWGESFERQFWLKDKTTNIAFIQFWFSLVPWEHFIAIGERKQSIYYEHFSSQIIFVFLSLSFVMYSLSYVSLTLSSLLSLSPSFTFSLFSFYPNLSLSPLSLSLSVPSLPRLSLFSLFCVAFLFSSQFPLRLCVIHTRYEREFHSFFSGND